MGYRRLQTLTDVARQGYWVELRCRCGHINKQNPLVLMELLSRRGASTRLTDLPKSMRCGKCRSKDFTASHCNGPEIWSGGKTPG